MTLQTPTKPGLGGAVVVPAAVTASDTFVNDGHVILEVTNGSGGSINVTVVDPVSSTPPNASAFNPNVVVAVAAGTTKRIGPFLPSRFNDPNNLVTVNYSATASVTAAYIQS